MHFRFTKQKNGNFCFLKAKASLKRPHQTEANYILLLVHWFVKAIYAFSLSSAIYLRFTKDMSGISSWDPPSVLLAGAHTNWFCRGGAIFVDFFYS
jgi:hypothetical protein